MKPTVWGRVARRARGPDLSLCPSHPLNHNPSYTVPPRPNRHVHLGVYMTTSTRVPLYTLRDGTTCIRELMYTRSLRTERGRCIAMILALNSHWTWKLRNPNLIRTIIHDESSDSTKVTAHLNHISHCKRTPARVCNGRENESTEHSS